MTREADFAAKLAFVTRAVAFIAEQVAPTCLKRDRQAMRDLPRALADIAEELETLKP